MKPTCAIVASKKKTVLPLINSNEEKFFLKMSCFTHKRALTRSCIWNNHGLSKGLRRLLASIPLPSFWLVVRPQISLPLHHHDQSISAPELLDLLGMWFSQLCLFRFQSILLRIKSNLSFLVEANMNFLQAGTPHPPTHYINHRAHPSSMSSHSCVCVQTVTGWWTAH